jgi:hypothetical protein
VFHQPTQTSQDDSLEAQVHWSLWISSASRQLWLVWVAVWPSFPSQQPHMRSQLWGVLPLPEQQMGNALVGGEKDLALVAAPLRAVDGIDDSMKGGLDGQIEMALAIQ